MPEQYVSLALVVTVALLALSVVVVMAVALVSVQRRTNAFVERMVDRWMSGDFLKYKSVVAKEREIAEGLDDPGLKNLKARNPGAAWEETMRDLKLNPRLLADRETYNRLSDPIQGDNQFISENAFPSAPFIMPDFPETPAESAVPVTPPDAAPALHRDPVPIGTEGVTP